MKQSTPRRYACASLIVAVLAASDTLLALALIALGVTWWSWLVAAAVVFHAGFLALAWWRFW